MASNTHLFLKEAIATFTAKKKIIQETDICFKEKRKSRVGLFNIWIHLRTWAISV